MPLEELHLDGTAATDLQALPWATVRRLNLNSAAKVASMAPTVPCALEFLNLRRTCLKDYNGLRDLKLRGLDLQGTNFSDGSILTGMPLEVLLLAGCSNLTNLDFLDKIPSLRALSLPPALVERARKLGNIRFLTTHEIVDSDFAGLQSVAERMPTAKEFWAAWTSAGGREPAIAATGGRAPVPSHNNFPRATWGKLTRGSYPGRDPHAEPKMFNLDPYYNGDLVEHFFRPIDFPTGLQTIQGLRYDIRGLIQLGGRELRTSTDVFPESVSGIAVHQKCRRIHILHGASFASTAARGDQLGEFVFHLQGGREDVLPIILGKDVTEWSNDSFATDDTRSKRVQPAWYEDPVNYPRIFHAVWENPYPEMDVIGMDYKSEMSQGAPFLIAITAE
jgi:hypothetical protein